jgi:hypothetical protein
MNETVFETPSRLVNLENENNKLKKQCPNLQDESEPAQSAGGQEQAGSSQVRGWVLES